MLQFSNFVIVIIYILKMYTSLLVKFENNLMQILHAGLSHSYAQCAGDAGPDM